MHHHHATAKIRLEHRHHAPNRCLPRLAPIEHPPSFSDHLSSIHIPHHQHTRLSRAPRPRYIPTHRIIRKTLALLPSHQRPPTKPTPIHQLRKPATTHRSLNLIRINRVNFREHPLTHRLDHIITWCKTTYKRIREHHPIPDQFIIACIVSIIPKHERDMVPRHHRPKPSSGPRIGHTLINPHQPKHPLMRISTDPIHRSAGRHHRSAAFAIKFAHRSAMQTRDHLRPTLHPLLGIHHNL